MAVLHHHTSGEKSTNPKEVVSLSHVTLRYGSGSTTTVALDDITLCIHAGERVCVLGSNGSGKSTLASVMCGLLAPDEGVVTLVGQRVFGPEGVQFDAYKEARRHLGLVFQNPDDQIVTSIVEDDVAFGPENLCLEPDEVGRRVTRELDRVALSKYARSDPSRLSGGQKQRVAIAGALAMEPDVLVLDEPGALLDVRGRRGIMRVMAELRTLGTTIVHITHFMEEALAADRVIVLNQGGIVLEGTPTQVFSHQDELLSLGLEPPFPTRLSTMLRNKGLEVPWTCEEAPLRAALKDMLDAQPSKPFLPSEGSATSAPGPRETADKAPNPEDEKPAILCDCVSYSYHTENERPALDNVSLRIYPGTSTAIVGQTGSGKSTLVRLLCGLEAPDTGSIVVSGIHTSSRRERRRLHGKIGYVMQHPERQLFAETVLEDVAYGPVNMGLSRDEVQRRCTRALELVGLVGKESLSPFQLSGGQQRLCAIAGVLAMQPAILLLDEPTAGLDPRGRAQVERVLLDIHARGVTTVRVTHSMESAAEAQQVIVLSQASLLMQGTPEQIFSQDNEKILHDAGLGLPAPLRWAIALGLDEAPLTMDALVAALSLRLRNQSPERAGEED